MSSGRKPETPHYFPQLLYMRKTASDIADIFQLPAGTSGIKSGPGCLSVFDLLPGRLLAISDLIIHVYG